MTAKEKNKLDQFGEMFVIRCRCCGEEFFASERHLEEIEKKNVRETCFHTFSDLFIKFLSDNMGCAWN